MQSILFETDCSTALSIFVYIIGDLTGDPGEAEGDGHIFRFDGGALALQSTRGLMPYLKTLATALEDDRITADEMCILHILARCPGLPEKTQGEALAFTP